MQIFFIFCFCFSSLTFNLYILLSLFLLFRRLRSELQLIRRKGAIRVTANNYRGTSGVVGVVGGSSGGGGSLDRPNIDINLSCARCRNELGRIINRGAPCRSCRLRVCKSCREFSNRTTDWVCIVCHKQM